MDRIWSPWRHAYVTRADESPGMRVLRRADEPMRPPLIVHEGRSPYVILNLYPYNAGHLLVVPRRHVATLALLTREELTEMARADAALRAGC